MSSSTWLLLTRSAFYLSMDDSIDRSLVAFVRILLYDQDWKRFSQKGKLPSAALDTAIATILSAAISRRLSRYASSLEVGSRF